MGRGGACKTSRVPPRASSSALSSSTECGTYATRAAPRSVPRRGGAAGDSAAPKDSQAADAAAPKDSRAQNGRSGAHEFAAFDVDEESARLARAGAALRSEPLCGRIKKGFLNEPLYGRIKKVRCCGVGAGHGAEWVGVRTSEGRSDAASEAGESAGAPAALSGSSDPSSTRAPAPAPRRKRICGAADQRELSEASE
jgi:hypothetical protein